MQVTHESLKRHYKDMPVCRDSGAETFGFDWHGPRSILPVTSTADCTPCSLLLSPSPCSPWWLSFQWQWSPFSAVTRITIGSSRDQIAVSLQHVPCVALTSNGIDTALSTHTGFNYLKSLCLHANLGVLSNSSNKNARTQIMMVFDPR